ncbi:MAG: hypothetical protein M1837_006465 [Sclerophora amabilis]|nr:MAG: hypothetical protein M1837_006465 [Sclerophora amabilis]
MATPKAMVPFLVTMMLVTGVCNTLLSKYQDMQCVRDCDTDHPQHFEQPVIQTAQMFIGEMGTWLLVAAHYLYRRYASRSTSSRGYQPVGTSETGDGEEDTGPFRTSQESANPVAKSLIPNDETRRQLEGWRVILLALPACCDIAGTTLMNVGLLFVAASIYQMTRGALVLFVGLFSVVFLRRRLYLYQWLALLMVVTGVAIVGLSGVIFHDHKAVPSPADLRDAGMVLARELHSAVQTPAAVRTLVGILLIAGAQVFTATQFVLEEWILEQYALQPLKVVGWEGVFGFVVTILGMIVLHFAVGRTEAGRGGYFDAAEGWREISQNRSLAISSVLTMISIGASASGFNFFGLSVTRTVSATSRSTIDTCRTLFIWMVSLGLGWETFKWLQIIGFIVLVVGTFWFNDILPKRFMIGRRRKDYRELLPEDPIEHI